MSQHLIRISFLFLLVACGGGNVGTGFRPVQPPKKEEPLVNIPQTILLSGAVSPDSVVTVRELAPSRLVQLTAIAEVVAEPAPRAILAALEPSRRQKIEWLAPEKGDCEISQVEVSKKSASPLRIEVLLWGWEKQGQDPVCRMLMERIRAEGLRLTLTDVLLRPTYVLPELRIQLDGMPRDQFAVLGKSKQGPTEEKP